MRQHVAWPPTHDVKNKQCWTFPGTFLTGEATLLRDYGGKREREGERERGREGKQSRKSQRREERKTDKEIHRERDVS